MKRILLLLLTLLLAPSAPCETRPVSLRRDFSTLHGTLLVPDGGTDTAVLIIAGSGPTDRNGNNAAGLRCDTYRLLAEALEEAGIASLRYDKRAIGSSRLEEPSQLDSLRFDDYIDDAAALACHLRAEGFARVVLLGHSEGALIALCAAQRCGADAVVSVCGAGYPLDELLLMQLSAQLVPARMDLYMEARSICSELKQGRRVGTERCPRELLALFAPGVQTFLISQMRCDPRQEIRRTECPVLVIGGENDLQVPPGNAEALAEAQPRARKVIVEGMTHPLKHSAERTLTGQLSSVYANSTLPLDPAFVEAATDFIRSL